MRPAARSLILALLIASAFIVNLPIVGAATFIVTNPDTDLSDSNPGNGVCSTSAGNCTLRAAVEEANALPGADTITMNATGGSFGYIRILNEIVVNSEITFISSSARLIQNDGAGRVFTVTGNNARVTFNNVRISGGSATYGGGINITSNAQVTLEGGSHVFDNRATYGGGISLTGAQLTVTGDFTDISGNGSAGTYGGGIYAEGGSTVSISAKAIVRNNLDSYFGGGVYLTGTDTSLGVTDATISGNTVTGSGGGIYAELNATVVITDNAVVQTNDAAFYGSGIAASNNANITVRDGSSVSNNSPTLYGGGVSLLTGADLALNGDSFIEGNDAQSGAGIFLGNPSSTVTIDSATLAVNEAMAVGGGIYAFDRAAVFIYSALLLDNTANRGGGLYVTSSATAIVSNSTFSDNSAGTGGAVYADYDDLYGQNVTLRQSTIGFNTATTTGGIYSGGGVVFGNSFIGNNTDTSTYPDVYGTFNSLGYNLIENTSGSSIGGILTGNHIDVADFQVNLLPLANNGGVTLTHSFGPGSLAGNLGSNNLAVYTPGSPLTTDQRGTGYPRISGTSVDIGAWERPLATFRVTATLQGRPAAPHPSRQIRLRAYFYRADGAFQYFDDRFADLSGTATFNNVPLDMARVRVKGTTSLAEATNFTFVEGINTYTTPTLREGDADDSNVINITDFSILAATFGRITSTPGFDPRADFNGDGSINISDFSLLAANFGQAGAPF
ncbi:MAG: choice-of-anchor Q domain-containing protein [Chloroflexota bacterium]|nr:choice-of-anchor Q domain-containing protein [Chloroflexota bacterium]